MWSSVAALLCLETFRSSGGLVLSSVPSSGQMCWHFGGTQHTWRLGQWISSNGFPGMLNLIPICLSSQAALLSCNWPNTHRLLCTTSAFIWGSSAILKMEAVCYSEMPAHVTITLCNKPWKRHRLANNCHENSKTGCAVLLGRVCWEIVLRTLCQVDACCCRVDLWSLRKRGLERCPALYP